jgi:hypothetical protein
MPMSRVPYIMALDHLKLKNTIIGYIIVVMCKFTAADIF